MELSSSQLAETVHRFRTTTRRLQTLLEEIVTERDRNQRKLLKILDRIRRRAGKVRDLDAQLAALRSLKIPQEPRRKTQLTQSLIELRAKHEKTLRKMLTKDLIRDVRKRLKRAFKELALQASGDPLAVARQMLDRVARPAGPLSEDVLHQYRTVVKRARYAAEFAPKSTKSAQFIAEMKRMQDVIGNWHDWLTLTQTASGRLGAVNESSLVAALHNVTSGKLRHAVAALSASPAIQSRLKVVPASSEPARKPSTIEAQADSAA
ncbi:MAG TPA: CHAD domain-containing protein [Candidatus Sulfotelmatobacter sp.]|nr:CHAD domain-containing protein [Candidatus Sulfotelmatobacter sp.]